MPFQPAQSGDRATMNEEERDLFGMPVEEGRKARCGRSRALAVLDYLLTKQRHQAKLYNELEAAFEKDAVGFFKSLVMPLLPRESKIAVESDGIVVWGSLTTTQPPEAKEIPDVSP